jgi:DNA (cytosine-5)-methyltransferase 1
LLPIYSQVVKDEGDYHDKRRLFYSSIMNDNLIDSIIEKANVRYIKPKVWQTSVKIFLSICLKFHLMKDCSSVNFEVYISVFICNNCWFLLLCDFLQVGLKLTSILPSDFYYDMEYCVDYSTFRKIPTGMSWGVV